MRVHAIGIVAFGLAVAAAGHTEAALINGAFDPGVNQIQDTNYERLIKDAANMGGAKIVEANDVFEGIVNFETVNGTGIGSGVLQFPGPGSSYQLTAYFKLKVLSVTETAPMSGLYDIVFGAGFADGSTVIELYENTAVVAATAFDPSDTAAGGIARATSGTLLSTIELDAMAGDYVVALSALKDLSLLPLAGQGSFSYGLSLDTNPGGLSVSTVSQGGGVLSEVSGLLHDFVGSGSLKKTSTGVHSDWMVQTDVTVNFMVPEPASMTLFAIGALAVGGCGYRRRKQRQANLAV